MYFEVIEKDKFKLETVVSLDQMTLDSTAEILQAVKSRGFAAVLEYSLKFSDIKPEEKIFYSREDLKLFADHISTDKALLLQRVAERIKAFALAQKNALSEFSIKTAGFNCGQKIIPLKKAACYAPGGRYPLPSSVLMTAVTARAAGVERVLVASPKPTLETFAAAYFSGADQFIALGGPQIIAGFAFGADPIERCDIVVGPGNKYVTAAKQLVNGVIGIDMLAGPSELLILVDESSDLKLVAADLLAQAEHDADARPLVISLDKKIPEKLEIEITLQLKNLATAETAKLALRNSKIILVKSLEDAIEVSDLIAPEHLEIMTYNAESDWSRFSNYGAIFIGSNACEVIGDYGIGPNHVLPTSGSARFSSGLSVYNFLKTRTFLREESSENLDREEIIDDTKDMAKLEGLAGHYQAALARKL